MMNVEKPYIIITSINPPTLAVEKFGAWRDWNVVVIGDRKSPPDWKCDNVVYLGIDRQHDEFGDISRMIPENTYARKILGYIHAVRAGATCIFETDDDNIPFQNARSILEAEMRSPDRTIGSRLTSDNEWVNIYKCFGAANCWPRGFPLELIRDAATNGNKGTGTQPWAITQFLADEDPDVDAIYRMTIGAEVYFAKDRSFLLDEGTYCPFNSQATLWLPTAFPLLFLPVAISDRVTDILRGYMALSCLWKAGHTLRFSSPVVHQKRNDHILHRDFVQEYQLYANAVRWAKLLKAVDGNTPAQLMRSAIEKLVAANAIGGENLQIYDCFLRGARLDAAATA